MDDLISRQAAIDAVSKGCQELRGVFGRCEENLLDLPSAQRWIPCSERLPEPYTEVLATLNDGSVYVDVLNYAVPGCHLRQVCFYRDDGDYPTIYDDRVVAWMPLPEPYEPPKEET